MALPLIFACGDDGAPPPDLAPLAVGDMVTTVQGNPITIDVLANDTDPEAGTLTVAAVESGFNGTTTTDGTQVTYTPDETFFGLDAFSYTISDAAGNQSSSSVFVMVSVGDALPVAMDDTGYAGMGYSARVPVLANDSDPEGGMLIITAVAAGPNGTVAHNGTVVTYTPNDGYTGDDTFTYTIADENGGEATATVSMTVLPVDGDNDGLSDYQEGTTYQTNPGAHDTDGDGISDGVEVANGTDPLDPASVPPATAIGITDGFETGNYSSVAWSSSTGDAGPTNVYTHTGSFGYNLGGGGGTLTSYVIDTSAGNCAISWSYWGKRGPDTPETVDVLRLQYRNNLNFWVDMDTWQGGATDPSFSLRSGSLEPTDAAHPSFQIRFRSTGTNGADDFYIDDVNIEVICALDTDNDGLADIFEIFEGTDINITDSDSDGFTDGEEVNGMGTDPLDANDPELEGELNNSPDSCSPIGNSVNLVGELGGNTDFYCLDIPAGTNVILDIDAEELGSPLDSYLRIFDTNQLDLLASSNDNCDLEGYCDDSYLSYRFEKAGTYYVDVSACCVDSGNFGDWYMLRIAFDRDSDGLADDDELNIYGTDPTNPDTDGDSLYDGYEIVLNANPHITDTDGDGLTDGQEVLVYQTSPANADTDNDGLSDVDEIFTHNTDPRDADTDSDGLADGDEINVYNTDPYNPDTDGDGLSDGDEIVIWGSDPTNTDSDGDGLLDGDEVNVYGTDPANTDSDGDGLLDGDELSIYGTDPANADTDGDGLADGDELNVYNTDPLNADTDNDGLSDGEEINVYNTDPLNTDSDGDGLSDGDEVNVYNTDPANTDSDGDGLLDGDEVFVYGTDPANADTDNDGLPDGDEINIHGTDPLNADTDGDGFSDGTEVTNNTDPLNPGSTPPTIFFDGFETGDLSNWTVITTGDLNVQSTYVASGAFAARFGGAESEAHTLATDVTACGSLSWQYWGKRGPERPDSPDFLRVDYLNNVGVWVTLDTWFGAVTDPTFSVRSGLISNPDAIHPAFQLRFFSDGTGANFDHFFVDNVAVICGP